MQGRSQKSEQPKLQYLMKMTH